MARFRIRRQLDGSWTIRGERKAGKQLAAHKAVSGVRPENFKAAMLDVVETVSPSREPSPAAEDSAGIGGIAWPTS